MRSRTCGFEWIPFAAAVVACTTTPPVTVPANTPVAQTAADVAVATDWDAGFVWAAADPVPIGLVTLAKPLPGQMPEAVAGSNVASTVANAAAQIFQPTGCAAASASGNVVTFTLNNCSGPLGLTAATGTATATFTPTAQGLQIQLAGNNIAVDSGRLDLASQGVLTFGSDMVTKTFQANTSSGGTGPYGNNVARTGTYTLTWQSGSTCGTINSSFTDAGSASTTQLASYVRCRAQCPQSGTVTQTVSSGTVVTVTLNGSINPSWAASDGETGTLTLQCP